MVGSTLVGSTLARGRARASRALRAGLGAALAGWAMLAARAAPAHAHAPPLGARVLSAPGASGEVIVTNRGLVFRDPGGGGGRLLCNEALRISTAELPNVALLGDGALLVASSSGLRISRDRGCTWSGVGDMEFTNTPALAADPNDADRVVIASYDSAAPGLRVTHDAGQTWAPLYATAEGEFIFSLAIAADSATLYATAATYAPGAAPAHSLLRSRDGGARWERVPLPLDERDYAARLGAVSPDDAATLALYSVANQPGLDGARLLVSHDAGETFQVALERPEIRGVGFGERGEFWVAARDGLYQGDERSGFTQTSAASELGCVLERAGALFVCGHYAGLTAGSGVGVSRDGGQRFERWLDFQAVDAAVDCPAGSLTAALCAGPWLDWQLEMSGQVPGIAPGGALIGAVAPAAPAAAAPAVDEPAGAEAPVGADSDAEPAAACALRSNAPGRGSREPSAWLAVIAAACLRRRRFARAARVYTAR